MTPVYDDGSCKVYHGDCCAVLPVAGIMADLILTSPPYFNARPEYAEWATYGTYLGFLESVFTACHQSLVDGRYLVVVVSPVIVPRTKRLTASQRKAIPFDLHGILDRIGFEFMDDIIWVKPQGAGVGRGQKFAHHRRPLAYKPEVITEYILVYRRRTDTLIDDLLCLPDRIEGPYQQSNVWYLNPEPRRDHPAPFPYQLAHEIIRLYSAGNDLVLDPMAGSGTTLRAAKDLGRRGVGIEIHYDYLQTMIGRVAQQVLCDH